MLQPGGEREGRRVDGGRGGVLQAAAPAQHRGQQVSELASLADYILHYFAFS